MIIISCSSKTCNTAAGNFFRSTDIGPKSNVIDCTVEGVSTQVITDSPQVGQVRLRHAFPQGRHGFAVITAIGYSTGLRQHTIDIALNRCILDNHRYTNRLSSGIRNRIKAMLVGYTAKAQIQINDILIVGALQIEIVIGAAAAVTQQNHSAALTASIEGHLDGTGEGSEAAGSLYLLSAHRHIARAVNHGLNINVKLCAAGGNIQRSGQIIAVAGKILAKGLFGVLIACPEVVGCK